MKSRGFENYRLVYSHLWQTYGQSWSIRASFIIRFISRIFKLIALPVYTSRVIEAIARGDYDAAKISLISYIFFSFGLALLTPLESYIGLDGESKKYRLTMKNYFDNLLGMDLKFFNNNMSGYITTAVRQYTDSCLLIIRAMRSNYLNILLTILLPVIVIFSVHPLIGLFVIGLSVIQGAYLLWASQVVVPYRKLSREQYKNTSGFISDTISNIVAVKSSSQEHTRSVKAAKLVDKENVTYKARFTAQSKLVLPREMITVLFLGIVFAITITFSKSGQIGLGGAVLIFTYALTILNGLYAVSDALDQHDDFVDKIIPALEVLGTENIISDLNNPQKFTDVKGDIELKKVSFSYKETKSETLVFDKLSLIIPAGQKVGVVGLSGAGKSTLAKLLLRFDDVDSGSITIDGINIKDVLQSDLRRQIAYVPQEPLLFHSTIKENILLSKPDATENEVASAAKSAHAAGFIGYLPSKYDSVVGERGVKLSGGQKQRIAIARAVLQQSPIIILDEATSALDSESEEIIKASFKEILKGKTAIVVAHRLSTLSDMDRIVVIDEGKIVEDGTHNQLKNAKGLYSALWKRQQMHLDEPLEGDDGEA